jgi:transcriptional regulator with XRE-family HTH domain
MTYDDVLAYYGTQAAVAAELGIGQGAVSWWKRNRGGRIPKFHQLRLYVITKGRLVPDEDVYEPQKRAKPRGRKQEREPALDESAS